MGDRTELGLSCVSQLGLRGKSPIQNSKEISFNTLQTSSLHLLYIHALSTLAMKRDIFIGMKLFLQTFFEMCTCVQGHSESNHRKI